MANHNTNINNLDNTSTTSSLGELVTGVQEIFELLIAYSDTILEGSYIIEREKIANTLHSLTDLFEAINVREEDNPSPKSSKVLIQ